MAVGDENSDLVGAFQSKTTFMKSWKPASSPSNRDRLELYALQKQALSGDAPTTLLTSTANTTTAAEQSKYQAWRSKRGMSQAEAMRSYISECDRQIRVYGHAPPTPMTNTSSSLQQSSSGVSSNPQDQQQQQQQQQEGVSTSSRPVSPRGLAAIPLLCAAASERRLSYLRRLAHTNLESAWWSRQESLCATPGTVGSLPETLLIGIAALVEHLSLSCDKWWPLQLFPKTMIQSFLWPLHNCFLSLWMGLILVFTTTAAAWRMVQTLLWGARRTGVSLASVHKEEVQASAAAIESLGQTHQPLTARLIGLILLPCLWIASLTLALEQAVGIVVASFFYALVIVMTWWYWWMVCPWLSACLLGIAIVSGNCFALIDLAGV